MLLGQYHFRTEGGEAPGLAYHPNRSDHAVYCSRRGRATTWRVEDHGRLHARQWPQQRIWSLTADQTGVPGLPPRYAGADEYWKYAALLLCVVDGAVGLSGVGMVSDRPRTIVPEFQSWWLPQEVRFTDAHGQAATGLRLESMARRGFFLARPRTLGGRVDEDAPLILSDRTRDADLDWLMEPSTPLPMALSA